MSESDQPPQRRLRRPPLRPVPPLRIFTPLRYPGGKAKLAPYVKEILTQNRLLDGEYVEPYAGGAAIALELLLHEYVSHIHINDFSRPVHAFWRSVLDHTDELCKLIRDTPLTVRAWDEQKRRLQHQSTEHTLELGFATFYLNRTNRSGILNGGIIGGRDQSGPWKIDARYNANELVRRVEAVARMKGRISLTRMDAAKFLRDGVARWPARTLIYLDPPYYLKGPDLYLSSYEHDDHAKIARFVRKGIKRQRWIVSYDNAKEIRSMYAGEQGVAYTIGYSARAGGESGREVMFFDGTLTVPPVVGPVQLVQQITGR